ncbi:hypothetical protein Tco_1317479 [Tanacetum coccineum]
MSQRSIMQDSWGTESDIEKSNEQKIKEGDVPWIYSDDDEEDDNDDDQSIDIEETDDDECTESDNKDQAMNDAEKNDEDRFLISSPDHSLLAPLLDVLASVIPRTPTTPTPPPIPTTTITTTEAPASTFVNPKFETLSALHLRVSDLEKEVKELKQADHSTTLRASIRSEVPSAVNEYLGLKETSSVEHRRKATKSRKKQQKSQYTIKSSDKTVLAEFDQKQALFDSMHESKSFNKHPANKTLYHALMGDQDPPAGPDQGLKKRKTSKDAEPYKKPKSTGSSKDTIQSQPKSTGKSAQAEETVFEAEDTDMPLNQGDNLGNTDEQPNVKAASKHDWFQKPQRAPTPNTEWNKGKSVDNEPPENWLNDLANAEKPPLSFDDLMSTPIDFSAFAMNRLKISKLTKADLVGPVYNLLKGTCKSCVELEYNMEECYRSLSDQLDWNNPKGKCCSYDLSKPLPFTDIKYTASTTKIKATKYEVEGLEDMVPNLWSPIKVAYDNMTSVTIDKWYRYGRLKEIVVRRADQKLYKFMEGDFPRLHLNDIKDMLLLVVQNRLNNLKGDIIVDLAVALRMYTRRIVIQKRVEDLQLGVESYYKKLNISKPRTRDVDMSRRALYTTLSEPQGVIFEDKLNRKRLMRTEELYKFSDGTLTSVCNTLDQMLKNLRLGYNKAMERRKWTATDQKWTRIMIKYINQQLLKRRIMRSLEKFIGGREYGTDIRLFQRTI